MNKTKDEVISFLEKFSIIDDKKNVDAIIAVPFVYVGTALGYKNINLNISVQNVNENIRGAYTGEISVEMIKSIGVKYSIVGHSERRTYFGETDDIVNRKVSLLLNNNIKPILCIGESIEDRNNNTYFSFLEKQLKSAILGLDSYNIKNIIIAYEPVWAIGTGKSASSHQAEEIHCFIRDILSKEYSKDISSSVPIIYGGSCNSKNAPQLFSKPNIDGGLIGTSSLDLEEFLKIIDSASKYNLD